MQNQLLEKIKSFNVPISSLLPQSQDGDAAIILGGKYDGVHIQVGQDYYHVVCEMPDDSFIFITGKNNLEQELAQAINHLTR